MHDLQCVFYYRQISQEDRLGEYTFRKKLNYNFNWLLNNLEVSLPRLWCTVGRHWLRVRQAGVLRGKHWPPPLCDLHQSPNISARSHLSWSWLTLFSVRSISRLNSLYSCEAELELRSPRAHVCHCNHSPWPQEAVRHELDSEISHGKMKYFHGE